MTDLYNYFHCVRKTRIESYKCKKIEEKKIIKIPIPNITEDEYIIPLCKYIPEKFEGYFLKKFLWSKLHFDIERNTRI